MEYHCLIASLEQLSLDNGAQQLDFAKTYGEILGELSHRDRGYVEVMYSYYDVVNILGQLSGRDVPHNGMGQMSAEDIALLISGEELPEDTVCPLPDGVVGAIEVIMGREEPIGDIDPTTLSEPEKEMLLLDTFYGSCRGSDCRFLSVWGEADRGIRCVCAGGEWVEDAEVIDAARDSEWYGELQDVLKIEDFVLREHSMDKLRWNYVEGLVESGGMSDSGHTADINAVLCYMVQMNIIERWAQLSKETGRERFQQMVDSFTAKGKI